MEEAFSLSQRLKNVGTRPIPSEEAIGNLYVNHDGLPHGGTLYGILLNSEGASVFGLGLSPGYSSNAILRNVEVKELRAKPEETVRAQLQRGPFNDLLDMKRVMERVEPSRRGALERGGEEQPSWKYV